MENLNEKIPAHVSRVTKTLQDAGFEAYLVGGCVRDLLMKREPKDWDVTTNATPEEIMGLFEKTFYENDYGTVGVVSHETPQETLVKPADSVSHETNRGNIGDLSTVSRETSDKYIVEVTPYRLETKYSDSRHPDSVSFSKNLADDLKRRDFTINAIAYDPHKGHTIDPYKGHSFIKDKILRTVGEPAERFGEDALRLLRAIRFSTELDFEIEKETREEIEKMASALEKISKERIRDEFAKILMTPYAMRGIQLLHEYGLLKYVVPELEKGIGVDQNGDHIYTVWEHNIRALQHAVDNNWPLHVRLAALFHDISKPETRFWSKEKNDWTFYGHDVVGGRVSKKIMERLKFPKKMGEVVSTLVRHHLFFSDVDKITLSAVRRIVRNVGTDNVWDLMKVRACDRIGMGRPKEKPYRLRKYEAMIEEAMRAPVSVGMLKTNGARIMEIAGEKPGPRIGWILHALLEEALDDPAINKEEYYKKRIKELSQLSDEKLRAMGEKGREKKEEKEKAEIAHIRKRHWVK